MECKNMKKTIALDCSDGLDLSLTLDCGQCFRWSENDDGSWHAVVQGKKADVYTENQKLYVCGDGSEGNENSGKAILTSAEIIRLFAKN